jgi:hypothetical protein
MVSDLALPTPCHEAAAPLTPIPPPLVSIKSVASTLAYGAMKYYDGNLTTTTAVS